LEARKVDSIKEIVLVFVLDRQRAGRLWTRSSQEGAFDGRNNCFSAGNGRKGVKK